LSRGVGSTEAATEVCVRVGVGVDVGMRMRVRACVTYKIVPCRCACSPIHQRVTSGKNNNKNHLKLNKTKRKKNNINAPERYWCAALAIDDAVSVGFPLPTDVTAIRLRYRIIIVFRSSDKSCGCVLRNFSEVKY